MKILLTNDDGIESSGLWELHRSLRADDQITVVAPASEQSGTGASITLFRQLEAVRREGAPCNSWSVEGTPSDCVRMALHSLLPDPPDLILSGINPGTNAGHFVLSSGTVGGVITGALLGIPGIAFSSTNMSDPQFSRFTPYIGTIVHYATVTHPLPAGTILNVNFPDTKVLDAEHHGAIAGIRLARQGSALSSAERDTESDVYWLNRGYITVVPVFVAELTHWPYLSQSGPFPS